MTLPQGLSDTEPTAVGEAVLSCWDAFLDVVTDPRTELSRPSRLPGWTGRDVLVHLGAWPDSQPLEGVVASAREGGAGEVAHPDEGNARLLAAHADATTAQVVQALVDARERTEEFFDSGVPGEVGRLPSRSTLGPLPALSLVHAAAYELAVHAMDLAPCGAPAAPAPLLDRGLAALIDITGALCARHRIDIRISAASPDGGWAFDAREDGGWTTRALPPGPFAGTGVRGSLPDLLDASAGRAGLPGLLLQRRLVVQQLGSFMRLAPLVGALPGLPGGRALQAGLGGLGTVTGLLGRLRG